MTQEELLRLIDKAAVDGWTALDLEGEGLTELPPEIGKLTNLRTLVLGRLNKKGLLDNDLGVLPDELRKLTELRSLFLCNINLAQLPKELADLQKLKALALAGNQLEDLPEYIENFNDLRALGLGDNRFQKVPEVLKKLKELRALYLWRNPIKELPDFIGNLTNLETLSLVETELRGLPENFGKLTNLKSLDLGGKQLEKLPASIGQITSLRSLSLIFSSVKKVPVFISQLANLQSLNFGFNRLEEVPTCISQLVNLQSLNLSGNQLEELPASIGQLKNLRSLNLSGTQIKEVPAFIGQLKNLQSLNLSGTQIKEVPAFIGQLTSLQSLDLSNNPIEKLPTFVGHLTNLRSLNLNRTQLQEVPAFLGHLTNLRSLNLNRTQLQEVPAFVSQLTKIRSLDFSNNLIKEVPAFIGQLMSLQSLDFHSNQISEVPQVISCLSRLNSLNVWNNKISQLPDWIHQLKALKKLDLRANRLPVPPEILGGKKRYEDAASAKEVIDYYFKEKSDTPLYEAKLLIVGEGEAGKTTLAKKLQDPDYELKEDEKSTEGIKVLPYEFDHPDGHPCKVNIWDFGGQEIYHATHQFFLTERAVYALVTDSRQGNTDFYFWLNVIQLHGADSPVILIKNEKNDRPCAVPDLQLRGQFKNLKDSIEVNLADNRNLDAVKATIQHHITHLSHVGDPLPKTWANVRSVLENQALGSDNYISLFEYRQICAAQGIPDRTEQNRLSRFLHNLGVFLHFQSIPQLAKTIFLTPAWSTDAVYKVLDTPKVRKDCGRFTQADLQEIWKDNQYADVRSELLALMQQFEVCYEITGRQHHYIAPHLLEANLPEHLQYQDTWDTHNNLILTYHYPFKPKNIFPRFIVALHQYIEQQRLVWKHGVVLLFESDRAEIIEDAHYNNANIRIRISGVDKKRVLAIIGHELERIHSSFEDLQYQTLIPCNCSECKDSQEPHQFEYEVLQLSREKQNFELPCYKSFEQVDVNRLIDDVVEPRVFEEHEVPSRENYRKRSNKSPFGDQRSEFNFNFFAEQQYQESRDINIGGNVKESSVVAGDRNTITNSSQITQHGTGDNIAGDKVTRDKIQTQNKYNADLAQAARDIKALLDELSEEYNPNTEKGQTKIGSEALAQIKANPQLKQHTFKAISSGSKEALERSIQHPIAKVVIEGIEDAIKG